VIAGIGDNLRKNYFSLPKSWIRFEFCDIFDGILQTISTPFTCDVVKNQKDDNYESLFWGLLASEPVGINRSWKSKKLSPLKEGYNFISFVFYISSCLSH
jgi:hypothetical protein